MAQPDIHDLNRVMAEVCGIPVYEETLFYASNPMHRTGWVWAGDDDSDAIEWDPYTNHNQMALVKGKLREMGVGYNSSWGGTFHHSTVWNIPGEGCWMAKHESELISLEMAVAAWWKERVK